MKRSNLFLLVLILMTFFSLNTVDAVWWNNSWTKRQEINITNTGSLQTNYPVKIDLTYDSNMSTNFDDIRVLNSSNGLLDFWLQDIVNSTSVTLWVKINSLLVGKTTIYLYYGNSGVNSTSNGSATFLFFDDFNDNTMNSNLWTEADSGNKFKETGGQLVVSGEGGGWTHTRYSTSSFNRDNLSLEFDYLWNSANPSYDALMMGWKDDGSGISYTNFVYGYYNPGGGSATTVTQMVYEDSHSRGSSSGNNWIVNKSYDVRLRMKASGGAFYDYSVNNGSSWTNAYDSSYSTESTLHIGWPYHSGVHIFDNVRVRPWMTNEPTSSFGVKEDVDNTPPEIILNLPIESYNSSSQSQIFNFTAIEDYAGYINCSIYIDSVYLGGNSTVSNGTLTSLNVLGISGGIHNWSVFCTDITGNSNSSLNRSFYIDLYGPAFSNVGYSPNNFNEVDPNTNLTFNASVNDARVNISTVFLQYYNGTAWTNLIMTNNLANNYNVTITTLFKETNYTFRIWSNDTFGNINQSVNQTFSSYWDCTWNSTIDFGQVFGFDENKFIGNITINNTGDVEYPDNNCSLDFRLSYDLAEGRIYYEGETFKNLQLPSGTISAGTTRNVDINSTFQNGILEETATITLDEFRGKSDTRYRNTTVTIVSTTGGPYLYQLITSNPTNLDLTTNNFSLYGYVRNLVGDDTALNTAYNVSFNWTLPNNFLVKDGISNLSYKNLSNSSLIYNNINLTFNKTNLPSLSPGVVTVYLHALGFDSNGSVIVHSENRTLLTESFNLTLNCYGISDGIYVTACGNLDPDEPAATNTSLSSGADGGGGGGWRWGCDKTRVS